MTHKGTNTFIIGQGNVGVIDPGPMNRNHLDAILTSLSAGERISHIFVTHSHLDHSPLSKVLAQKTGAPILAFGKAHEGRSPTMEKLALQNDVGGGEGIDHSFEPDLRLENEQVVETDGWSIAAIHTPGHLSNHMCIAFADALFTGDHVMGWASSLVSPPDGDLGAFMRSCERLRDRNDRIYFPGHGDAIKAPAERIQWLIDHRRCREDQIMATLSDGVSDIAAIADHIYSDIEPRLLRAATRNVYAHLIDLWERKLVRTDGLPSIFGQYSVF